MLTSIFYLFLPSWGPACFIFFGKLLFMCAHLVHLGTNIIPSSSSPPQTPSTFPPCFPNHICASLSSSLFLFSSLLQPSISCWIAMDANAQEQMQLEHVNPLHPAHPMWQGVPTVVQEAPSLLGPRGALPPLLAFCHGPSSIQEDLWLRHH